MVFVEIDGAGSWVLNGLQGEGGNRPTGGGGGGRPAGGGESVLLAGVEVAPDLCFTLHLAAALAVGVCQQASRAHSFAHRTGSLQGGTGLSQGLEGWTTLLMLQCIERTCVCRTAALSLHLWRLGFKPQVGVGVLSPRKSLQTWYGRQLRV